MRQYLLIENGVVIANCEDVAGLGPRAGEAVVHDGDYVTNGSTQNPDNTFSAPVVAKYTLESAKAMIVDYAEAFENHVSGNVSIGEKLSWSAKEAAATSYLADPNTVPADQRALLQAEADQTGETLTELSNAIMSNATAFRQIAGSIAGLRRATRVALEAEPDPVNYTAVLQTAKDNADALAVSLGLTPMNWDV
ncbi:hypothetical protein [uncultured Roseibium sp.]|uniref:hypothetical protein n=1 Tax=uncultured Roseibium sp. TaxID=1936171 RepID=UPI0026260700|nr:hypothetical protein [uncultured Roseibium sp.]